MSESFNYLFQYLEKENIVFDKSEFLFQIQSHPDYPSLLSIVDTLNFFNIENGTIRVLVSEMDILPNRCIVLLNEDQSKPQLYFMEKKGSDFTYMRDKKAFILSPYEKERRWGDIVLLIEKSEIESTKSNNKFPWIISLMFFVFFIMFLYPFEVNLLQTKLFFLFPTLGMLFSIAALKDLFGTKSELLNSFCNMTTSTNCTSVVESSKWRIFEIINFSDLSIIFFSVQLLGFFLFSFSNDITTYFIVQKMVLITSIPVLFLSIYYQKFVENKWCPICLSISAIILLECGYLIAFQNIVFSIPTKGLVIFSFLFLLLSLTWSELKKILTKQKELKEFQLKANRFQHNFTIFKNSLLANDKVKLPESYIILGNKESNKIITIVSSPFCSHCKDAHEIIDAILDKHYNDVQIQIILKTYIEAESDDGKRLFRNLMKIYTLEGEIGFRNALKKWFDNTNLTEWLNLYSYDETNEFDPIFNLHVDWCNINGFLYTPTIFINSYEFPKGYEKDNLKFFMNEFIDDDFQ